MSFAEPGTAAVSGSVPARRPDGTAGLRSRCDGEHTWRGRGPEQGAIRAAFDAWRAGTGGPFDLLAEDASWTIAGRSLASRTYAGREDFMCHVIRPFNARMSSPLKPEIRKLYADGDTVIVHFDAAGIARDGRPYVNSYAWFLTMAGGKVTEATAFYDSIAFNDLWERVGPDV